jgi:2-amino-4-hydroxy-6-hydroxymethyldihydropteridine diphosphokinase
MIYYLALGSNMGDRLFNIQQAIGFLKSVGNVLNISSIYETEPVNMTMAQGIKNVYNLAISIDSALSPFSMLKTIKNFEKRLGRDIMNSHNKPRTIDIDILLAESQIINTESLTIPHKEMHRRGFVLIPLNEIAPEVVHPVLNKKIKELLSHVNTGEQIRKIEDSLKSENKETNKQAG